MALIEPYFDTTLTLSTVQLLKAFETWTFDSSNLPYWKFFSRSKVKDLVILRKSSDTGWILRKIQWILER
ncbi:MAG: hypothetical protein PWP73_216 [Methanococcus sp.]|jgi:hypothetical protein|uniref:Uncharacterized protein n=2 Tax=Methanococcus maripaludis TaxID=39152 RepID=A0A2Z5PFE6_METMI|nr:hypothetical protein [Methanococcus maripaludis]MDK2928630.1 hypothetical protein [Methanococcus sp.]BAP60963.1 hypothetical protein MMKA1_08460 [Methanococcus maripaludis KA1]